MQYCMNCGAQIGQGARFCPSCGANVSPSSARPASEETFVRPKQSPQAVTPTPGPNRVEESRARARKGDDDDDERVIFTVRPTLLFIKIGYALAALGGVLLVAALTSFFDVPYVVSVPLALALLIIPAYHHVRRNLVKYTLTDAKIEIEEGFFSQTTRNLPLRNIQDVTVKTTLFQRALGFGDVVLDNAGEEGGATILDNIPEPRKHMDMLLRELRRWR